MQISEKICHLRGIDVTLRAGGQSSVHFWWMFSGRVTWDWAWGLKFGLDVVRLMDQRVALGAALGSAARIFEAVINAESSIARQTAQSPSMYSRDGRGESMISFAAQKFQGLLPIDEQTQKSVRRSADDALVIYAARVETLRTSVWLLNMRRRNRTFERRTKIWPCFAHRSSDLLAPMSSRRFNCGRAATHTVRNRIVLCAADAVEDNPSYAR